MVFATFHFTEPKIRMKKIKFIAALSFIALLLLYSLSSAVPADQEYVMSLMLLSLFTCSTLVLFEHTKHTRHPFNVMIQPLTLQWIQSLPWYVRFHLMPKTYVLCLNFSSSPLEHTLVPHLKPAFNFKHRNCQLNGFYQERGAFLIEISHPQNDVIAIHHLWKELKNAGIYFRVAHLLLSEPKLLILSTYR